MEDGKVTEAEATELIETLSDGGALSGAEEDLILDALSADGEITQSEVNNLSETLSEDGKFTEAEKELVAEGLLNLQKAKR
jgi:polyhydroxyalkanoate synthesis regulator phasin